MTRKPGPKRWLLLKLSLSFLLLAGCTAKPADHAQKPAARTAQNIVAVTIDLCPSHRAYERRLFQELEAFGRKSGRPVPIAVAVSGGWLKKHQAELAAIRKLQLNIIWVNHSYTHSIDRDFLNNPEVDFRHEVLANVALMKKNGLQPSKYFRFPGLVHNAGRLKELAGLGYRNLDADVGLGKGEKIKPGAIILVHGNGNEQPGVIDEFIRWLKTNKEYRIVPLDEISGEVFPAGTTAKVRR